MTRRNKLVKFTENLTFDNVFESFEYGTKILIGENGQETTMNGQWSGYFGNKNPITLELACGRGEYCIGLAKKYPHRNFIGVDIKGARIWKGAQIALAEGLENIAFLRIKIETLANYIEANEIQDIWITFPDPFLKSSKYNRRLTSPNYLKIYHKLLPSEGLINLKTDSNEFYTHTKGVIVEENHELLIDSSNIYSGELPHQDLDIKTFYERMHLKDNRIIKFVQFRLNY